jgi:uncharacterized membrane protein
MSSVPGEVVLGQRTIAAVQTAPVDVSPESIGGRLTAVDALRGLVMVLMVLDHTRDFFQDPRINPTDPATTTVPLFFTRWVTHLCAPVFVFLAGSSAYLARALGKWADPSAQARFLAGRGLFLIVLELTLVRIVMRFEWGYRDMLLEVIWAIGWSFLILAALLACRVKTLWVGCIGAAIVLGHNLLDITPLGTAASPLAWSWLRTLLLRPGALVVAPDVTWRSAYPIVPWFGVMALGYAFGGVLLREKRSRLRITFGLGITACLAFVALRASGIYGDPAPWTIEDTPLMSVLAFLNCRKYPPSLLYVLMTLGLALLILCSFEAVERGFKGSAGPGPVRRLLITFGRVPLFFFLLHFALVHAMAIAVNACLGNPIPWNIFGDPPLPAGYGYELGVVYAMWLTVLVILYWPCQWFSELRRRRRDLTWLSYF